MTIMCQIVLVFEFQQETRQIPSLALWACLWENENTEIVQWFHMRLLHIQLWGLQPAHLEVI